MWTRWRHVGGKSASTARTCGIGTLDFINIERAKDFTVTRYKLAHAEFITAQPGRRRSLFCYNDLGES
jgi:hypothetical protein